VAAVKAAMEADAAVTVEEAAAEAAE